MAIITGTFEGKTPISIITVIGLMEESRSLEWLFDKKCEALVQDARVTRVIINLRDCTNQGQAGFGQMARLLTTVKNRGGSVCLVLKPDSRLKDKLRLCCLLQYFPVYDTESEAAQAFEQQTVPSTGQG